LVAAAVTAHAATDGGAGASSVGSAEINLSIPELIKISNLEDIDFGTYSGSGDLTYSGSFTVAGNDTDASATYRITGLGTGSGDSFNLSNGYHELAYSVAFEDASGSVELISTQTVGGRTGIHSRLGATSRNATYSVQLSEDTLRTASSGNYFGSLTLMVEPE
jgi:hypothetical protein